MSWFERTVTRNTGPPHGTPAARAQEAYLKMGEAVKNRDDKARQAAYQELADAAVEGNLELLITAIEGVDLSLLTNSEETRAAAWHRLTIAIHLLKDQR